MLLPQPTIRQAWGRQGRSIEHVFQPRFEDQLPDCLAGAHAAGRSSLAFGLGRSYGDSALNSTHSSIDMNSLDRVLAFDKSNGLLRAEAGLSLDELIRLTVPMGWFLPVTPGTRFVTLGGAVANDVHGKNHHHKGTIGNWIRRMEIVRSDGKSIEASATIRPQVFAAAIGGLGLTGIISWVEIQLVPIQSAYLSTSTHSFETIEQYFELSASLSDNHEHIVAWIDSTKKNTCRGLLHCSNWLNDGRMDVHQKLRKTSIPFNLPDSLLNQHSIRAFNSLIYKRGAGRSISKISHYSEVFYPLDGVGNWNRMYGRRGFYQYQCVLPSSTSRHGTSSLLREIAAAGQGSFLAVLKEFGDIASPGLLSFPMAGTTLALDFPNLGAKTHALFEKLDQIVTRCAGRLYPAKDARMPPHLFASGYQSSLSAFRLQLDPGFSSDFWRRIAT